uniref:DNA-dependent metalloprotease SPRTN n=1 Tax=Eptatretus burgeri TaxID=7764 RepID=A0A8C4NB54_EPTBU
MHGGTLASYIVKNIALDKSDDSNAREAILRHAGRSASLIDASWEMADPNPDVRALFMQFNDLYFWGKLAGVEVKWSTRMTLCAGLCCYEGRGGLCCIKLSEPLLKLRPRKDLVETLLHEMIHALLFVTQNNRDRDGHGPEFCSHMHRINSRSGTNITVGCGTSTSMQSLVSSSHVQSNALCRARAMSNKEGDKKISGLNTMYMGISKMRPHPPTPTGSTYADIRTFIPFFGKGHTLGGSLQHTAPLDETPSIQGGGNLLENANDIQSLISSWKDSASAKVWRDEPIVNKTLIATSAQHTIDKDRSSKTVSPYSDNSKTWHNKWSVSNTRVFQSRDGSPVKCGAIGPRKNRTGIVQKQQNVENNVKMPSATLPSFFVTRKEVECSGNLHLGSAAQTAVLNSSKGFDFKGQKMKPVLQMVNEVLPVKRPCSPFSRSGGDERSGHAVEPGKRARRSSESSTWPQTSDAQSEEGAMLPQVGVTVHCPACQNPMLESQINEHLDTCLCKLKKAKERPAQPDTSSMSE